MTLQIKPSEPCRSAGINHRRAGGVLQVQGRRGVGSDLGVAHAPPARGAAGGVCGHGRVRRRRGRLVHELAFEAECALLAAKSGPPNLIRRHRCGGVRWRVGPGVHLRGARAHVRPRCPCLQDPRPGADPAGRAHVYVRTESLRVRQRPIRLAAFPGRVVRLATVSGRAVKIAAYRGRAIRLAADQGRVVRLAADRGRAVRLAAVLGRAVIISAVPGRAARLAAVPGRPVQLAVVPWIQAAPFGILMEHSFIERSSSCRAPALNSLPTSMLMRGL
jgi:hypothetical protein